MDEKTRTLTPITRTVDSDHFPKCSPMGVTLGENNMWEIQNHKTDAAVVTPLSDIKVSNGIKDMVFAQVIINLFLFNKMDARRVVIVEEKEFAYPVKTGEEIVIPPLPDFERVKWVFTLGGPKNTTPLLRFTFDNVKTSETSKKRKRKNFLIF